MMLWLTTIGISIAAFTSTNIDDIFVLMAFFSDQSFRAKQVVVGQYVGIGALIVVSLVLAYAAMAIPPAYVRLLGLLPLFLGLKGLWELRKSEEDTGEETPVVKERARILAVAAVTFANGGDNIGVYVPMFSTRPGPQIVAIIVVFLLMTGLWCLVGHYLVNHPKLEKPIRSYGRIALPIVLSAVGILILMGI